MAEAGCFRLRGQQEQRPVWGHGSGGAGIERKLAGLEQRECGRLPGGEGRRGDQGPNLQSLGATGQALRFFK